MREYFRYQKNEGFLEQCRLADLAEKFGTPLYVYSETALRARAAGFQAAFAALNPLVRYSCKANANLHILKVFRESGIGADVISVGELAAALAAGFAPADIIMEGPGKKPEEIASALEKGVALFSCESLPELEVLSRQAAVARKRITALLRLNPDIEAGGHHYISTARKENKFGMTEEEVLAAFQRPDQYPAVRINGLHLHLGSQISGPEPYLKAIKVAARLHKIHPFQYLDLGGGFPVAYDKDVADISVFGQALGEAIKEFTPPPRLPRQGGGGNSGELKVIFEPGRYFVAPAGFLLTRITYRKERPHKKFLVVDAGMNDLIRPSLYDAFHHIWPVRQSPAGLIDFDVVGPICESGDFLAKGRPLAGDLQPGDLLLVGEAGAYGFAMASNYNGRLRPAEVMVSGQQAQLIRRRETIDDLLAPMSF